MEDMALDVAVAAELATDVAIDIVLIPMSILLALRLQQGGNVEVNT